MEAHARATKNVFFFFLLFFFLFENKEDNDQYGFQLGFQNMAKVIIEMLNSKNTTPVYISKINK